MRCGREGAAGGRARPGRGVAGAGARTRAGVRLSDSLCCARWTLLPRRAPVGRCACVAVVRGCGGRRPCAQCGLWGEKEATAAQEPARARGAQMCKPEASRRRACSTAHEVACKAGLTASSTDTAVRQGAGLWQGSKDIPWDTKPTSGVVGLTVLQPEFLEQPPDARFHFKSDSTSRERSRACGSTRSTPSGRWRRISSKGTARFWDTRQLNATTHSDKWALRRQRGCRQG